MEGSEAAVGLDCRDVQAGRDLVQVGQDVSGVGRVESEDDCASCAAAAGAMGVGGLWAVSG